MTTNEDRSTARLLWSLIEPVHAVSYFSQPCADAMDEVGLKGFWMGYFAGRAAPLGACPAAVVAATFYNFAPARVRRAIPEAWQRATPTEVIEARSAAAAIALRQWSRDADEQTRRALPLLESAAVAAKCDGRVLAAANQQVAPPADPVARLWQATTTLREHRGDGHLAALITAELDGLEAHVLAVAVGRADAEQLKKARGWNDEEWRTAVDRLRWRGLVDDDGVATDDGHLLTARIEDTTDDLAAQPYRDGLTATGLDLLRTVLRPLARAVTATNAIPFPNPIGLPAPR